VQLAKSPTDQAKLNAGIESVSSKTVKQPKATQPKVKNVDPVQTAYTRCVDVAVQAGKITTQMGQQILRSSEPDVTISNLVRDKSRERRNAAIDAVRLAGAWDQVSGHGVTKYDGLLSLMRRDPTRRAKGNSIEGISDIYKGKYHSQIGEFLSKFRTRDLGFTQDTKGLEDFVSARYGKKEVSEEIKELSKTYGNLRNTMVDDRNKVGGSINKNVDAILPQVHDQKAMAKATGPEWMEFVKGLKYEIRNKDTAEPINPIMNDTALNSIFDSITTNGLNKLRDFEPQRKGSRLADKGSNQRVLYFKDDVSWLAYNKRFGKSDIFTLITDEIESMAGDTALMQVLGTNPERMFNSLLTQIKKEEPLKKLQTEKQAKAIYDVASGNINAGEFTTVADFMQSTRNIITSAFLYKAFLASFSDLATIKISAKLNDLESFKIFNRQLKLMMPTKDKEEMRKFGVKLGLLANQMIDRAAGGNRHADIYGTGLSTKLSTGMLRGTFLTPFTESGRGAFGMEYFASLADDFVKTFDELSPARKEIFATYNITPEDWNAFRSTTPLDYKGVKFANAVENKGEKFLRVVLSERDDAVITAGFGVQALTTGGYARGSIEGQFVRGATQFSSFSLQTTMYNHRKGFAKKGLTKAEYFGKYLVYTTVLGGIALQAKDIEAGREPRAMNNIEFLTAAFMQGGGGGFLVDLASRVSNQNRYGNSGSGGPQESLFKDMADLSVGNIRELASGEETKFDSELVENLFKYSPNAWQVSIIKRSFLDELRIMLDPSYENNLNKIMRQKETEYDTEYFWKRGEMLPEALQDN
jgi:hypothetical protein